MTTAPPPPPDVDTHEDKASDIGVDHEPLQASELVRRVSDGTRTPDSLSAEDRQQCVDYLTLEGFTTDEIAQVLRVNERTIRRDRTALRQAHAMKPTRMLGDELLGEFERYTQAAKQQLVRLARDPDTPPYCRLWATEAAVRVQQRLIDTAFRLKYLETGQQRLEYDREAGREQILREHEQFRAELGLALREDFYKGCEEDERDMYPPPGGFRVKIPDMEGGM